MSELRDKIKEEKQKQVDAAIKLRISDKKPREEVEKKLYEGQEKVI